MSFDGDAEGDVAVTAYCYTHARRLPNLIAKFPGGGQLPFGMTLTVLQVSLGLGSFLLLWKTMGLWHPVIAVVPAMGHGPIGYLLVMLGIPVGLAVAARFLKAEGRSAAQFAAGVCSYWRHRRAQRSAEAVARPARAGRRIWVES